MAKIERLPSHVADLIAAGEVVERPGSAVKELMENSIDAGASVMTVEIKNGGMTYIRVTDNGCGMSAVDAKTAFLRHATSKLRDERGLEAIETLGFRGEALAAIAAVSRIVMRTCERGSPEGTEVRLEGGEVLSSEPCGCPEGTTIVVSDLFFNTPARQKFMKSDRAEGLNVSAAVLRCAMSHPEVSVKYIKDGREEFHTAGDGRLDSSVYSLLGREAAASMLAVETDDGSIAVRGFVSSPSGTHGNRTYQFFFVNGRFIKSRLLQAALEQAYKNSLFTGRFPGCVLYITMPPSSLDVNVHPTKTEVRFLNERSVFDGVYYAALAALGGGAEKKYGEISSHPKSSACDEITGKTALRRQIQPDSGFVSMTADKFRDKYRSGSFKTSVATGISHEKADMLHDETQSPYQTKLDLKSGGKEEHSGKTGDEHADWHLVGEVLATYIIVERAESIFLIDKHAAHERIVFDRLKKEGHRPMSQVLLMPVICQFGPEDMAVLEEEKSFLDSLGFSAEFFGEGKLAVREAPEYIDTADIPSALGEIFEMLRTGRREDAATRRDKALRTIACKASVKAGRSSGREEMLVLCEKVLSGEVKYCPHGRPVAMELTKAQLDRGFRRT